MKFTQNQSLLLRLLSFSANAVQETRTKKENKSSAYLQSSNLGIIRGFIFVFVFDFVCYGEC